MTRADDYNDGYAKLVVSKAELFSVLVEEAVQPRLLKQREAFEKYISGFPANGDDEGWSKVYFVSSYCGPARTPGEIKASKKERLLVVRAGVIKLRRDMTRLKLRFEALAIDAHRIEDAMRMLVGALGDDCPNPGTIKMAELQWHNTSGAEALVQVLGDVYVISWMLSMRHASNSETYKDSMVAAKKIRGVLKEAGIE